MSGAQSFLTYLDRVCLPLLSGTRIGRQILKNKIWWDLSSVSVPTALLATRGYPHIARATQASRVLVQQLLPWLPPNTPDAAIMEFGCGLGLNCIALAPHCQRVVGIDTSKGLLRLARRLAKGTDNVSFVWYDGGRLPLASESFKFVFSVGVFERIEKSRVQGYLCDIRRVLEHDGKSFLYFLSNRALRTEFIQRLSEMSYFCYADVEATSAVSSSGMRVLDVLDWPTAVVVVSSRNT